PCRASWSLARDAGVELHGARSSRGARRSSRPRRGGRTGEEGLDGKGGGRARVRGEARLAERVEAEYRGRVEHRRIPRPGGERGRLHHEGFETGGGADRAGARSGVRLADAPGEEARGGKEAALEGGEAGREGRREDRSPPENLIHAGRS